MLTTNLSRIIDVDSITLILERVATYVDEQWGKQGIGVM